MPGAAVRPADGEPLRAFASYSWKAPADIESIARLVIELRLRGFVTFRDAEAMPPAGGIEAVIRAELARSTVFVPYLTPDSLESDPVVDLEFHTAAELRRLQGSPVVLPVARNLGTDRNKLTTATWARLQHDFSAQWNTFPGPGDGPLDLADAAAHANNALRASFAEGAGPADGCWELGLATRGERPPPTQLTVDATGLVGGPDARAGSLEDWERIFAGLCDLKRALTAHGRRRRILLRPACHLSAALAVGWVFRRAAGWRLEVAHEDVECRSSDTLEHPGLVVTRDYGAFSARGGRLVVCIDLVPRGIRDSVIRAQAAAPRAVLSISAADGSLRIPVDELGAMAGAAAAAIKDLRGETHAEEVALYLASPAPFAALLGAEFGALGCPLLLHEHDNATYQPSIVIPG